MPDTATAPAEPLRLVLISLSHVAMDDQATLRLQMHPERDDTIYPGSHHWWLNVDTAAFCAYPAVGGWIVFVTDPEAAHRDEPPFFTEGWRDLLRWAKRHGDGLILDANGPRQPDLPWFGLSPS